MVDCIMNYAQNGINFRKMFLEKKGKQRYPQTPVETIQR